MKSLIKEPLFHFLILGALVFLYYEIKNADEPDDESFEIVLDEDDINRLRTTYQLNWNTLPDSSSLSSLINEEIKSEILYREAKRLNLHHNDEIIRRRLRQKYEFLIDDLAENYNVDKEEFQAFYEKHEKEYYTPVKWTFRQYYSEEIPAKSTLNKFFNASNEGHSHIDNFHINAFQNQVDARQIARLFGEDFSKSLESTKETGWISKPIRSGFGWHIIHIDEYIASAKIPYEEIKSEVHKDWKNYQRLNVNEALYEGLLNKYRVVIKS